MEKFRWLYRMSLVLMIFALMFSVLAVSSVQARPSYPDGAEPVSPNTEAKAATQAYNPQAFQSSWGISPDTLISCDPEGNLLNQLQPANVRSSHSLQNAACQKQAALDEKAAQAASVDFTSGSSCKSCTHAGTGGDGKDVKVYSGFSETRYVYLQCGKKVAEYGPPSCGCSGNYHYTYTCKKPPTVYITIPCFR